MPTIPLRPDTPLNAKHEAFCRALAAGTSQAQAYVDAGYNISNRNVADASAARLLGNVKIKARVAELQAQAAEKTGITIKSLTDDLIRLCRLAEANAQVAAGVAAVGMIAKLHGLVIDKAQIEATLRRPAPAPGIDAGVIMSEEDWQKRISMH